MKRLMLHGGIANGRIVNVEGAITVVVPELLSSTRVPTDSDRFWLDPFEYEDPELNPHFRHHHYCGITGDFLKAVDVPFVSAHRVTS